ncbi:MAG: glycosyltransferase family 2 protein [Simkania negevensis]|nr:glycosyltransferase family 2 protein [Simkania negevensis]
MEKRKKEKSLLHRVFIFCIILALPLFIVKEYRIIRAKKQSAILPAQDFYAANYAPLKIKSFTFIVLTHNNIDTIKRNFDSLLGQKYSRFQVLYLDQGSTDGTIETLTALTEASEKRDRIKIVSKEKNYEIYESYYQLVSNLSDDEVIVHLYGNDWLAHLEVLSELNQTYENPDVWLAYGQYVEYPTLKENHLPLPKKNLAKKKIQKAPWMVAHLKTFYAGLFKKLKIEGKGSGNYFLSLHNETSLLYPIAEIGKSHVRFIPDVLYVHDRRWDKKKKKLALIEQKERVPSSQKGQAAVSGQERKQKMADLIIISDGTPTRLHTCLESILRYVDGLDQIYVIYQASEKDLPSYEALKETFQEVHFVHPSFLAKQSFKAALLKSFFGEELSPSYLLLTGDGVQVHEKIDLESCIKAMQKTGAYGFYFHLGEEGEEATKQLSMREKGIYCWMISRGKGKFMHPDRLKMGLYRKVDLERDLKEMNFTTPTEMVECWKEFGSKHRVGLFYNQQKLLTQAEGE